MKEILLALSIASLIFAQRQVENIEFVGNEHISSWELMSLLTIPKPRWYSPIFGTFPELNSTALQNDLTTIRSVYWSRGFLDVRMRASVKPVGDDTNRVQIKILIDEGKRYLIGSVRLLLPQQFDSYRAGLALGLEEGAVFSPYEAQLAKSRLWRWIADKGYPYAEVQMNWEKKKDSSLVNIVYDVQPGKKAYLGKVKYKGLRNTKTFLLRREITTKHGTPYSYNELERNKEALYSTGLFKIVSVELADTSGCPDTVDVIVSVVERKRGWYGFSVDFGSHQEYDMTAQVSVEWGHRNVLGNGQSISLKASVEGQVFARQQLLSHRYEFVFFEPWTFSKKLPSTLTLYFEPGVKKYPDPWRVQKIGGTIQLMRRIDIITHWAGITYERADVFGVPEDQAQEIKQEQGIFISRKLTYTYQRDSRSDILMPDKGSLLRFSADFVGGPLGGDENYLKADFLWTRYMRIPFWHSIIYASRLCITLMGKTEPGREIAVHNRLTLGGANTIRGFPELSIGPKAEDGTMLGGEVLGLFSLETRFPIIWKFYGHLFLDAGQVWMDWRDVNPYDIRSSVGAGMAFATPVGPIRVDYAKVLTRFDSPPYSRWHITLMYAF